MHLIHLIFPKLLSGQWHICAKIKSEHFDTTEIHKTFVRIMMKGFVRYLHHSLGTPSYYKHFYLEKLPDGKISPFNCRESHVGMSRNITTPSYMTFARLIRVVSNYRVMPMTCGTFFAVRKKKYRISDGFWAVRK